MNKEILTILKNKTQIDIGLIFIDSIKSTDNKQLKIIDVDQFIISVNDENYHCFVSTNDLSDSFIRNLKTKSRIIIRYFLNDIKDVTIDIDLLDLFKGFEKIESLKSEELISISNKITETIKNN